ncbi:MAG: glycosyltransferase family 4 protein [Paludibacter sp.]|nr:glycosyltransferase family 4 protein [Paludibacter sp.]
MNILFLTLSQIVSDISNSGIYPDLLRRFANEGHNIYIVCPFERKLRKETSLIRMDNVHTLGVKTLNITKSNKIEKGIGIILIEYQYQKAIKKHLNEVHFDMLLYSTPPITFNKVIRLIKKKHNIKSYLLLKDIFPQNALDLGVLSKFNPLYWFFKEKERKLYVLSDFIGCMSAANVEYVKKQNPFIPKDKIEICPNSIELNFKKEVPDKSAIFSKYNIPQDVTLLIYGGNLGKPQGIDFLIKVLKSNSDRLDLFFIIAGNGTEYPKLDNWIKKENPKNVLLLSVLPKNEFDKLLQVSNIGLIFLDKRFTIPNYPSRLLSYMENRIPVLMATDVNTDIGKIAEENAYGLWVESGDLKSFNLKLNYMISDKKRLNSMGENAYHYLCDNFTVDKSYNTIMSHFK